jgi:thymidine kinase
VSKSGAIAVSPDDDHDSGAKRKAEARHKMTVTVDAPVFLPKNTGFHLRMLVDAHLNTVFTCYGAQANFVLRL